MEHNPFRTIFRYSRADRVTYRGKACWRVYFGTRPTLRQLGKLYDMLINRNLVPEGHFVMIPLDNIKPETALFHTPSVFYPGALADE